LPGTQLVGGSAPLGVTFAVKFDMSARAGTADAFVKALDCGFLVGADFAVTICCKDATKMRGFRLKLSAIKYTL
jgi:hypothetical protein